VEGSAPSKTKKETTNNRLRVINVEVLTTLGNFGPHPSEKQDYGDAPRSTDNLSGSLSRRATLRREQREQLESKQRENRTMGRKMRPSTDVASTALGKMNGGTPEGSSSVKKQCGV
jgi:hypothetical protein